MKYFSNASSTAKSNASVQIKESSIAFGITPETAATLPNPAELFDYSKVELVVNATRLEEPPRMDEITYELKIYSNDDRLNIDLLKKNIEKFGTISNTVKSSCIVVGEITKVTS
jgi:hypothetical protein